MIRYKSIILLLVVGSHASTFCSIAFDGINAFDMESFTPDSHATPGFALAAGVDTTLKIYGHPQDLRTHQCVVSILAVGGGGGGGNPTPMPPYPVGGGGSGYVKFVDNIVLSSAVHFVKVSVGTQGSSSIIEIDGQEIRAEKGHDREGFYP